MDFELQLSDDFLFFLELCKKPEEVFKKNSNELQMAKEWLHFLSSYPIKNINDRRLLVVYLSQLCAALIEGKLFGPFLRTPKESELEYSDVSIENDCSAACGSPQRKRTENDCCNSYATQSAIDPYTLSRMFANSNSNCGNNRNYSYIRCNCPAVSCPLPASKLNGVGCERKRAGADIASSIEDISENILINFLEKNNMSSDFLHNIDDTLSLFMDLCKTASVDGGKPKMESLNQVPCNTSAAPAQLAGHANYGPKQVESMAYANYLEEQVEAMTHTSTPSPKAEMNLQIRKLLEAIFSELRGDIEPGSNDYLEYELARYKEYVMSHSNAAMQWATSGTDVKMRHFLLLSLQNDLIKLLTDDLSEADK